MRNPKAHINKGGEIARDSYPKCIHHPAKDNDLLKDSCHSFLTFQPASSPAPASTTTEPMPSVKS